MRNGSILQPRVTADAPEASEAEWVSPTNTYTGVACVAREGGTATWRVIVATGQEWMLRTVDLLAFEHTGELERFEREAAALAKVTHPAIPSVREVFRTDASWCLVTTIAPGVTLRELVATSQVVSGADIEELLKQGLDALDTLHGLPEPIVHRGLNLDRLRVASTADGPMLSFLGFGEARVGASSGLSMVGSLDALAPEQAMGRAEPRSDLYALGLCLLALATHQPLHALGDPEGRRRRLDALTGLTSRVRAVLGAMLRLELSDRLASAREGLDVLSGRKPVAAIAGPDRERTRLPRWARRTGVVLLGLAVGLFGYWAYRQRKAPGQIDALGGWFTGHGAPLTLLSRDVPSHVAFAAGGQRLVSAGSRDEVLVWDTADGSTIERLNGDRQLRHVRDVALSPDGTTVALCTQQGLALIDVATGVAQPGPSRTTPCHSVNLDQDPVALEGHEGLPLTLVSLTRGTARAIVAPRPGDLVAAALSSGGQLAAAAYIVPRPSGRYGDGGHVLLAGPRDKRVVTFDEPVFEIGVSADGRFAVACTYAEAIVLDGATGHTMVRFGGAKVGALSRDGRLVALAMNGERKHDPPVVSVRERESQREIATFSGHSRAIGDLAFSPGDDVLLTASRDGLLMRWRVP